MLDLTMAPTWHTASAKGPRTVNADAVGAYASARTHELVFALADGVGDDRGAARAARLAASAAARIPAADGPVAAILAAQEVLRSGGSSGDSVLVVAMPFADEAGRGYRIGWVGDARAYAWDGDTLRQLTTDHTLAQHFRSRNEPVTPRMEHIVTTSVRTARAAEIGTTELRGTGILLLTSDGVHKRLTGTTMAQILRQPGNPVAALVETAIATGGADNATALLVDRLPAAPELTARAA